MAAAPARLFFTDGDDACALIARDQQITVEQAFAGPLPPYRTLGDVTSHAELEAYQAAKRAKRAAARQAAGQATGAW